MINSTLSQCLKPYHVCKAFSMPNKLEDNKNNNNNIHAKVQTLVAHGVNINGKTHCEGNKRAMCCSSRSNRT